MACVRFVGDNLGEVISEYKKFLAANAAKIAEEKKKPETKEIKSQTSEKFDASKMFWIDKHVQQNGNVCGLINVYAPFMKRETLEIALEENDEGNSVLIISYENADDIVKGCHFSSFNLDNKVNLKIDMQYPMTEKNFSATYKNELGVLSINFNQIKNKKNTRTKIKVV